MQGIINRIAGGTTVGRLVLIAVAGLAIGMPSLAEAQVAGSTLIGVAAAELRQVAPGWSARHTVLGRPVFNDKGENIGAVDDLIVSPDRSVSYVVINASRFIGVLRHDVAVPVSRLQLVGDKLTLPGATREALRASPAFDYK